LRPHACAHAPDIRRFCLRAAAGTDRATPGSRARRQPPVVPCRGVPG